MENRSRRRRSKKVKNQEQEEEKHEEEHEEEDQRGSPEVVSKGRDRGGGGEAVRSSVSSPTIHQHMT